MELRIRLGNALHNLTGFFYRRLCNRHRLESAFQSCVLLNMLAIFIEGRCADHLDFTTGQSRLQDIGCIHGSFRITGTNQIMNLIDHQNDVAAFLDLADETLHATFKLTAELGTGHQSRQVQQEDFLIPQLIGHITGGDPLGKALCNSSLTDTGFTDQARIILLPAVQDLDDTLRFHVAANDLIQLSVSGSAC